MKDRKRIKWEPVALMALVLGLGLWIAFGPSARPSFPLRPGATTVGVRIGQDRGVLECVKDPRQSEHTFRLLLRDSAAASPRVLSRAEAESLFGPGAVSQAIGTEFNRVFRALNITSWTSMAWVGIGLLGQLAFSGRMVLQWIISERRRASVITSSFWWFSLFGGVTLFSYFVWRQDPVGILGQASGIVIYIRNIRLLDKHARRSARAGEVAAPTPMPTEPAPSLLEAKDGSARRSLATGVAVDR